MREDDSNWFSRWEEELPSPEELMPISQTLITPDLALAFDIRNPTSTATTNTTSLLQQNQPPPPPAPPPPTATTPSPNNPLQSSQPNSAEYAADSADLVSGAAGDEPARTLKRPRLVWTPQLHKRFVDAVAHLGIKNAVPKTIMQLMSVDGLTRENVASHLQKYRLYLKRMQGLSSGGAGGVNGTGGGGGGGLAAGSDAATEHLFASSPVPAHFLHPGRPNSDHFLPFVPVAALQHHHHQQQMAAAAAAVGHPQLQSQYHRQMGHFGQPPNGQFEHPFLARQTQQPVHRMGAPVHNTVPGYMEDLESASGNGGRKVLTLFPTGDD
ncbi:transcription factor MYBC1 isoform X2 [Manihot esculenta]|uniref:Uncharacterized protein n=3 Tax=Manihot esculenta TaxID=3983 RepID=A0ACB7H309_MANES|nr:transcription factor MYBC1 isoform X2 [Manihot esculenta]XP_021623740.1 transcription factor MYBC1 isoform X2 [Manihot esculenta]KAG8646414.1 hypothetical protein MANES_09G002200v8 [Manihot esculenta]KAG8646415.1 hypothetical protein MANES_09G002200v8 [Manihot esculenta]OAY40181.1 hypothetical protein MANES_09G002200v8 [Manihot esculenta]